MADTALSAAAELALDYGRRARALVDELNNLPGVTASASVVVTLPGTYADGYLYTISCCGRELDILAGVEAGCPVCGSTFLAGRGECSQTPCDLEDNYVCRNHRGGRDA